MIMKKCHIEKDSLGKIEVPNWALWGPQTQRSLQNFKIGHEIVSLDLIHQLAVLKAACAIANYKCKKMPKQKADLIYKVCKEIWEGKLDKHFPTKAFQAGSGTQTNMNINEVIAHRANQIAKKKMIHPNDDANMSQSTNDSYTSSTNMTAIYVFNKYLVPAAEGLINSFKKLEKKYANVVKLGRTHIQDAVPLTFGQEVSGWRFAIETDLKNAKQAIETQYYLNCGGTAIGSGCTAPKHNYDHYCVNEINKILNTKKFKVVGNKYYASWSKGTIAYAHGAIKALAMDLYKIAQDIRFLASGPRSGFGEINIPQNEPGSSIMPGKVNPTQCEGMAMMCINVFGYDSSIAFLASQGNFELNTFGTYLIQDFITSVTLLSDMINSFNIHCVSGITVNEDRMSELVNNSLMLVTQLKDAIGYEKSAAISKYAYKHKVTLREANRHLNIIPDREFIKIVDPKKMV